MRRWTGVISAQAIEGHGGEVMTGVWPEAASQIRLNHLCSEAQIDHLGQFGFVILARK